MEATTAEVIAAIGTLLSGLGTIGLLGVASAGYYAWLPQRRGEDKYATAKNLIKMLLQMENFAGFANATWAIQGVDGLPHVAPEYDKLQIKRDEVFAECTMAWGKDWYEQNLSALYMKTIRLGYNLNGCSVDAEKREALAKEISRDANLLVERVRYFLKSDLIATDASP